MLNEDYMLMIQRENSHKQDMPKILPWTKEKGRGGREGSLVTNPNLLQGVKIFWMLVEP